MPLSIAASHSAHQPRRRRHPAPAPRLREVRLGELRIGDEFLLPWNHRGGTVAATPSPGSVECVLDADSPQDQDVSFSPRLVVLATGRVSPFFRRIRFRRPGRRAAA